jgi:hypothetical protein
MKTQINILSVVFVCLLSTIRPINAQVKDEQRMIRDIAIAENVLGTLIKQQVNNQRGFLPIEINGSYQAGHGVTFIVPSDLTVPLVMMMTGPSADFFMFEQNDLFEDFEMPPNPPITIEGTFSFEQIERSVQDASKAQQRASVAMERSNRSRELAERSRVQIKNQMDSAKNALNDQIIAAAKIFLVDYGDMITQLPSTEKIVITNQESKSNMRGVQFFSTPRRTVLEVEMNKEDMMAFKQGKISRDEAVKRVKVLNTETIDALDPDLELFTSMLTRLYRLDLSKSYFVDDHSITYERLRDFGVIYYLNVFASLSRNYNRFAIPALQLDDIDLETRNKKVKELYPTFEADLKDNIAEYVRVLKSIKDSERLVFQVNITKCVGCNIPSTLEVSVSGADLNKYVAGKQSKDAFLKNIDVKKGKLQ